MTDTGYYRHGGEIWHVVQRKDGGVVCQSKSHWTSADKETWERWKKHHGWEKQQ